jgi:arsenate reductase (thioredoxin)
MGEGLVNALWGDRWRAYSAGTRPGVLNPRAVRAMAEIGIDISQQRSKSVSVFAGQSFDLIVTVCDSAKDECPFFPGGGRRVHLPIPDPAEFDHLPEEEAMAHFRAARERLKEKLKAEI